MNRSLSRCLSALVTLLGPLPVVAQDPAPAKGPDKEVAQKIETLKDVVLDKKFARDNEGRQIIDDLLLKSKAGLDEKDQQAIVKALDGVFTAGPKVRPPDKPELYNAATAALGYFGVEGAKVLNKVYLNKQRFPEKKEWLPLRELLLKNLGRTKDESQVKFLIKVARNDHEAALQAAAGDTLGNFDESKEPIRKEIVGELMVTYGELSEKAGQLGSQNIEAQNAQDRLAALQDKWKSTLGKLTRQNFATFREWQEWYNKNKAQPW